MPSGRTGEIPVNVEGFEGMGTPLRQRRRRQVIFLVTPRQSELPEVDTTRWRQ